MRFRLSKLAYAADWESIYGGTVAKWRREQADRYVNSLWDTFERIAGSPEQWRPRNDLYPGGRVCFKGRHAILFRIREGRVEIARVLHDAMGFRRHLPGDFMGER